MAVLKVDISLNFTAKDDTASDKEQLQTSKTFEGKGCIPSSTWQLSCEKDATDGKWRLHVDLREYKTFETVSVLATGKAHLRWEFDDSQQYVSFDSSELCQQFDLASTQLNDLTSERVWSLFGTKLEIVTAGAKFSVDLDIFLFSNTPLSVSKLQSDLAGLLKNELHSDLVLIAEDKEFKVHKLILSGRSEVFERMLESEMKEKNENRIVIEDVKSIVLEKMLIFVYSGTLGETENDEEKQFLEDLFTAAEKYAILDLKKLAAQEMCRGITVQNAGRRLALACQFDEKELRQKCFQFIRDHCDELSETDEFSLF